MVRFGPRQEKEGRGGPGARWRSKQQGRAARDPLGIEKRKWPWRLRAQGRGGGHTREEEDGNVVKHGRPALDSPATTAPRGEEQIGGAPSRSQIDRAGTLSGMVTLERGVQDCGFWLARGGSRSLGRWLRLRVAAEIKQLVGAIWLGGWGL